MFEDMTVIELKEDFIRKSKYIETLNEHERTLPENAGICQVYQREKDLIDRIGLCYEFLYRSSNLVVRPDWTGETMCLLPRKQYMQLSQVLTNNYDKDFANFIFEYSKTKEEGPFSGYDVCNLFLVDCKKSEPCASLYKEYTEGRAVNGIQPVSNVRVVEYMIDYIAKYAKDEYGIDIYAHPGENELFHVTEDLTDKLFAEALNLPENEGNVYYIRKENQGKDLTHVPEIVESFDGEIMNASKEAVSEISQSGTVNGQSVRDHQVVHNEAPMQTTSDPSKVSELVKHEEVNDIGTVEKQKGNKSSNTDSFGNR